jgi:succinyl-CoA synthetase beta subunit
MEYQSRQLLVEYGVPVPEAEVADSPEEASAVQARLGGMVVVKAQVLSGGRGKAGGVRIARTPEEAAAVAGRILALEIGGMRVHKVLVSRAVKSVKEYYLSVLVDRSSKGIEAVFSDKGGITIEEAAAGHPGRIRHLRLDPFAGPDEAAFLALIDPELLGAGDKGSEVARSLFEITRSLFRLCVEKDCSLIELNPLSLVEGGKLVALDAKIVIDDNGLPMHDELLSLGNADEYGGDEIEAREAGLSYVGLDGNIGCMVNGAGLSMATMDLIKYYGAEPANFLDIGGSSNPEKVVKAFSILLKKNGVKAILVNIFGGITRCDDVANGIIKAKSMIQIGVPIVIRLIGTNDVKAREILKEAGIEAYNDLGEAIKRVVAYVA